MKYIVCALLLVTALQRPATASSASPPRWCFSTPPGVLSPHAAAGVGAGARRGTGGYVQIDSVNDRAPTGAVVLAAAPIKIRGWAVNTELRTAAQVLVSVDGGPARQADSCGARPDVALGRHVDAYAFSGFEIRLAPVQQGRHRLTFTTVVPDRRAVSTAQTLELVAQKAAPAVVVGAIDRIDGASPPVGPVVQRHDEDVRFAGWLAEQTPGGVRPLRAVDVVIDGRVVDRVTYGRRLDPASQPVGYSSRFPGETLSIGRHELRLRATLANGTQIFAGGGLLLDVVAPPQPSRTSR